ncbi:adenylate/guanylate cyclase domain-containing protein [Rhizobium sp. BG4]|uniref:adenylate/guanylate cyclase domain-containing protein n=1 Tax=Rhizobium sp. BG4 TaxID=2613770 RepID=UPI00193D17FD|nr:adenylate/guanylate cyclase domain-containing protein [Rhizobium sp. BG4]
MAFEMSPQQPAGSPLTSGVLVFLLTDVEGSTYRWEEFPDAMGEALERHDAILREAILSHGGHVFKTVGDSFHAVFSAPAAAVSAALQAQRALNAQDFGAIEGMNVRMAVHAGPVEVRGEDCFGPGINRASRLLLVAYGGQVLVSGTVADLLQGRLPEGSNLFDLGRHRFRDLQEPEQVFQLVAEGINEAFPPLRSLGARADRLPRPLTSLIGREAEAAELIGRLERARLLTLIGSGGAGKTRLAIDLGARLVEAYPDGVWFVELGRLEDPQLVAEQICGTIGVAVQRNRTAVASAVGFMREKQALLIIDNCEHLVDASADAVDAILSGCPSMSVLATSREPLGVSGENLFRVPSLAVPPPEGSTVDEAMAFPSVRLFVERAAAAAGDFVLTEANLEAVISICHQVDGIPLAIELAVPRLRIMRPEALAAGLRDRFRSLAQGTRGAPPRHRTLQTLFEWSYNLLSEQEQTLLRRLSVFVGGWTVESAAAVVSGDPIDDDDVLQLITSLADKSLVAADFSTENTRYSLLETTRQYAFAKLFELGERGRRRRLAEYMTQFYAQASRVWPSMPTEPWMTSYQSEIDNLRASLEWAFGPEGDADIGRELTSVSLRIWDELSLLPERERWFSLSVGSLPDDTAEDVAARLWLGRTSVSSHGDKSTFDAAIKAAAHFRNLGDQLGSGEALARAGAALLTPSQREEALRYLQEALELLATLPPTKPLAACLRSRAVAAYFEGHFAEARTLIDRSSVVARLLGDTQGIVNAMIALAELEFAEGHVAAAISTARQMIDHEDCNRRQLALGFGNLTAYLLASDRLTEARLTAFNGLLKARSLGWPAAITRMVEHLALIVGIEGDLDRAAVLLGYSEHFYVLDTASREITERVGYERLCAILETMAPIRLTELKAEGAALPEAEVVEFALKS